MLLNDFFTIEHKASSATEISAALVINAEHTIFEGHFPNQPVVPGVCMMQMVKEILELVIGKATRLSEAFDMKFLAIIDPQKNNYIQANITYAAADNGAINVTASLFKDELVHFKFKGQFEEVDQ